MYITEEKTTMPNGTSVAGTMEATFSGEVAIPKKKKPNTIVVGDIMMIPAIFSFVFSASKERKVINAPPTINEVMICMESVNGNSGILL
ncbi:MAG: hypothetical protein JWN78_2251 [Bacteroidota bacterium]|nr:hypothetical protein [Bacteroidota bacterium]